MRDAHRMKEKYDLSLDNRQIVSLLIGGIVVMGAVFVLGVVVGKKMAGSQQTAAAPDLLSALDEQATATFTFPDELTKKEPLLAEAPAPERPAPAEAPKPEPVKPEPAKPQQAAATEPPDAELPAPEAPKPQTAPAVATVAEAKKELVQVVPAAQVATRTREEGGLKDAFARATRPPAEAVTGGAWTLQLSASQSQDEADKFAARLREKGYAPFVIKADVPGRGTWYRVRMGSFASKDAANRYLTDFKRETQMDAFVAASN